VEVPRLQETAARPREVVWIVLERAGMASGSHQNVGAEGPELQEIERPATRDAHLAVEDRAAVGGRDEHVREDGEEDENDRRREEHQQGRCDDLVERALRKWIRDRG